MESVMLFTGIASPELLSILSMALEEYCRAGDIEPGTQAYEDAALYIMALFKSGAFGFTSGGSQPEDENKAHTPAEGEA
jgi:hypothetical protein